MVPNLSPETTMLIHRRMIREELERRNIERQTQHLHPSRHPLMAIRRRLGRLLITMGTSIAPAERPNPARSNQGEVAIAK